MESKVINTFDSVESSDSNYSKIDTEISNIQSEILMKPKSETSKSPVSPSFLENEEQTPVTLKISALPARSAFLSFFCKTKRPQSQPLASLFKENLNDNTVEPLVNEAKPAETGMKASENNNLESENIHSEYENENLKNENNNLESINNNSQKNDKFKAERNNEIVALNTENISKLSDTTNQSENDSILILSDGSDIEEIEISSRDSKKRPASSLNHEIISISSDDGSSSDCKLVKTRGILRRSSRINQHGKNVKILDLDEPLVKIAPLSDYSSLKDKTIDFTLPPVKPPTSNVNENLEKYSKQDEEKIPLSLPIPLPVTLTVQSLENNVKNSTSIMKSLNYLKTDNLLKSKTTNDANTIPQNLKQNQIVHTKTQQIANSPPTVKDKEILRYFNSDCYDKLDPSLREEILSRLSNLKKTKSSTVTDQDLSDCSSTLPSVITTSTSNTSNPTTTNSTVTTSKVEEQYARFNVIQRINIGTFDSSRTKNLLPTNSFLIYWKLSDTFGNMKRQIASNLRLSPFELVLTKARDDCESELYDSTRPSTLNLKGLTLQDFINRQKISTVDSKSIKKANTLISKIGKVNNNNSTNNNLNQAVETVPLLTVNNSTTTILPVESTYELFLYTKASYAHFKTLRQSKKQKIFDSVSFLQTAEAEISKFAFTPTITTTDDQSEESSVQMIKLNFKTATTKNNQTLSVQVASNSTVQQVLQELQLTHQMAIEGLRVVFDGEILKRDS